MDGGWDDAGGDRALAAEYYISDSVAARERTMFLAGWQLVGHVAEIPNPGDFLTASIFDQEFFLIRDGAGRIRGYWNVCPHRGHRLVEGRGSRARITCPYHAWTFAPTGQLLSLRRRRTTNTPAREEIGLFTAAVDQLAGFLFVNPSGDARPLAAFAPGIEDQIRTACPHLDDYVIEDGRALGHSYDCAANWKVLVDNYLECHHCGAAHASFDDLMAIEDSRFEVHPNYTAQRAPSAMKAENKAFPLDLAADVTTGHFWWLFPNTLLGQFPGVPGFYASRLDPMGPHGTRRSTWSLTLAAPDAATVRRLQLRSDWSVNVVSREDRALCESVQRGLRQSAFRRGWYVLDAADHGISEHAMRHFHQTYLDTLEGPCISD